MEIKTMHSRREFLQKRSQDPQNSATWEPEARNRSWIFLEYKPREDLERRKRRRKRAWYQSNVQQNLAGSYVFKDKHGHCHSCRSSVSEKIHMGPMFRDSFFERIPCEFIYVYGLARSYPRCFKPFSRLSGFVLRQLLGDTTVSSSCTTIVSFLCFILVCSF